MNLNNFFPSLKGEESHLRKIIKKHLRNRKSLNQVFANRAKLLVNFLKGHSQPRIFRMFLPHLSEEIPALGIEEKEVTLKENNTRNLADKVKKEEIFNNKEIKRKLSSFECSSSSLPKVQNHRQSKCGVKPQEQ